MFRNSRYGWKLGGALVLTAALTAFSGWRGAFIHPPAWRALGEPDRWHGQELRVGGRVVSTGGESFVIDWQEAPLEILGPSPAGPGELIEAVGTLDREGPILRPRHVRRLPPHSRHRWIWEGISLAVLALILANFLRHFAVRPEAARLRER